MKTQVKMEQKNIESIETSGLLILGILFGAALSITRNPMQIILFSGISLTILTFVLFFSKRGKEVKNEF